MRTLTSKRVLRVASSGSSYIRFVGPKRLLVSSQQWSRDEDRLHGLVRLISTDGRLLAKTRGSRSTGYTAPHPTGTEYACTGSRSCTIHSLRSRRLPLIRRIDFGGQEPNCLLYTTDGRWLIWGGKGEINSDAKWDLSSPTPPKDSRFQPLLRWDTTDWTPHVLAEWGQSTCSLGLSPDGNTLLVGGWDGGIQLWDTANWEIINQWQAPRAESDSKFPAVYSIQLTGDGQTLYASFGRRPYLRAFTIPDFSPSAVFSHESRIEDNLLLMPDARTLIVGDEYGILTLWDTVLGTQVGRYSADHERLFISNVDTGKSGHEVDSLSGISGLALSPDGNTLAVGDSFGKIHLIDLGA